MVKYIILIYLLVCLGSLTSQTQTLVIQPGPTEGKDVVVKSAQPDGTFGSLDVIRLARTTTGLFDRSLLKFNLASVQPGEEIVSAKLTLYGVSHSTGGTAKGIMQLVGDYWWEDDVNWDASQLLLNPEQSKFELQVPTSASQNYTFDVTSQVQRMVNTPLVNFGWLFYMKDENSSSNTAFVFGSSDNSSSALRPKLEIVYAHRLQVATYVSPATDYTTSNAAVNLHVSGGVPPYTYSWSTSSNLSEINNLPNGFYQVQVTDSRNTKSQKLVPVLTECGGLTFTFTPQGDGSYATTRLISESFNDNSANENYSGSRISAGNLSTSGGQTITRSLFSFDLKAIPSNAQVTNARLVLTRTGGSTAACPLNLQLVAESWNAKTATFNHGPASSTAQPVIQFTATTATSTYDLDVTTHLQKMISEANSDFGWVLQVQNESAGAAGKSAEFSGAYSDTQNLPYVIIELQMANFACNDLALNWNQEDTYDENGIVIHSEKTYMDNLGRLTQKLSKNGANEVMRTQTLYDSYGREAIQTLPAYTGNQLKYQIGFVRNNNGQIYDVQHFDSPFNKLNNPDPLQVNVNNTLGYYYSNNNSYDAYQATTGNPYTRTEYFADPLNTLRKVSPPGNAFSMGNGRETVQFGLISGDELRYIYGTTTSYKAKRLSNDKMNSSLLPLGNNLTVVKKVAYTPDNLEMVTYMDGDLLLATCFSGLSSGEYCTNITGVNSTMHYNGTRCADIHLPDADKSSMSLPLPVHDGIYTTPAANISYTITDLNTDQVLQAGTDYVIGGSRAVTFGGGFLSLYTGKSLKLRIRFSYNASYITGLLSSGVSIADAKITYNLSYGQVTRNSYDLAGRLRKTTQPKGYACTPTNNFDFYGLFSTYDYSHEGQLVASRKADQGLVEMVYDKKGRLRFSQNAEQKAGNRFSYTNYDKHGRIIEAGESQYSNVSGSVYFANYYSVGPASPYSNTQPTDAILELTDGLLAANKSDVSTNSYVKPVAADNIPNSYSYQSQYQNFRNGLLNVSKNANSTVWYNYDAVGRPLATITRITEPDFVSKKPNIDDQIKTSETSYDYFTLLVNSTTYQNNNSNERLFTEFSYDQNRRPTLTKITYGTNTVPQKLITNTYNQLNQLKRIVIGNDLQGVDYTYMIDGRLKAINHPGLIKTLDPGGDQGDYTGTQINLPVNKDLFGEILEYYPNDYQRTGTNMGNGLSSAPYDGLIHATRFKTENSVNGTTTGANFIDYLGVNQQIINTSQQELRFDYNYDEYNRLASSTFGVYDNQLNQSTTFSSYRESGASGANIGYDKNGNITRLVRNAFNNQVYDDLTYTYSGGVTTPLNNQLTGITDAATSYNNPAMNFYTGGSAASFGYNANGQMISSSAEGISSITYFASGLIKKIQYNNSTSAEYEYGVDGSKLKSKFKNASGLSRYTWYVGPYTYECDETQSPTVVKIRQATVPGGIIRLTSGANITGGYLVFHLTDHKGNVRMTFKPSGTGNGLQVLSYQDYYAFGGVLPGRKWVAESYDFGLMGEEQSRDGNNWDHFPLREYNHDLGRWFSPDPFTQFSSPYSGFGNNPVNFSDPSGGYLMNQPPPPRYGPPPVDFHQVITMDEVIWRYRTGSSVLSGRPWDPVAYAIESQQAKANVDHGKFFPGGNGSAIAMFGPQTYKDLMTAFQRREVRKVYQQINDYFCGLNKSWRGLPGLENVTAPQARNMLTLLDQLDKEIAERPVVPPRTGLQDAMAKIAVEEAAKMSGEALLQGMSTLRDYIASEASGEMSKSDIESQLDIIKTFEGGGGDDFSWEDIASTLNPPGMGGGTSYGGGGDDPKKKESDKSVKSDGGGGTGAAVLDGVQTALDVVGLIPGLGEIADGVNSLIYTARGDYVNAGLSAAAMVPFAGWAATGGKFINKAVKYQDRVETATDIYHAFPRSFDNHIIQNGAWSQRITDRANWFELPGTINGTKGMYQIGINNSNEIFHRSFIPLK